MIFDNSKLIVDAEFTNIENERLDLVKKLIPDFDKFNICLLEETLDCSLKHIAQVFLNYDIKWQHLDGLSLMEWLEKYPLTNTDLNFNVNRLDLPEYF